LLFLTFTLRMKKTSATLFCLALLWGLGNPGAGLAQAGYSDFAQLSARLARLTTQAGGLAQVRSLGKTATGKDIWLLTLGKGDPKTKPALALVAGVEGTHLAGTEVAVQLAEKLLANASQDSVAKLLETKTLYIIPLVNPDAAGQYFAKLKYERSGNARPTDDDRDGKLDEDGPEDLNGDGLITYVRVQDPTGTHKPHDKDPRVMVKADPLKGERGQYLYFAEGVDNDKDGKYNEDGEGGVALNKNFTFDYPIFTPGAGEFPVSEPENRALLDFLYAAPNVYAVFTFGPANNLTEPIKFDRLKTSKRIITGWLEKDAAVNDQVSKLYGQAGLKDAPSLPGTKGDFFQTAYFHYGRLSFSTPAWWLPKDTAKVQLDNDEAKLLRWAANQKVANVFVDWAPIQHPDFPGQKAEVGGLAPFAKLNPPAELLGPAADKHLKFLTSFAQLMPGIALANLKTEAVSGGLTRITVDLHNPGLLPTTAEIGERVQYVDRLKVELKLGQGQTVLAGRRVQLLGAPVEGNGKIQLTWLVSGSGNLTLEVGSATVGQASQRVALR
jgi:hypothetical protein